MDKRRDTPRLPENIPSLADILPRICQDLALERKVNEMALRALWPEQVSMLAGAQFASQSKAIRLQKRGMKMILQVQVATASLASELSFFLPVLKEALNRFAPQTGIVLDQIQLKVGTI